MDAWTLDITFGDFITDFVFLSVLFLIATLLRRYVPFLQHFLVPNNVVAGILGFIFASIISIPFFEDISSRMGTYVYHLLALTFIAVGLSQHKQNFGKAPALTGITLVAVYMIQGLIGLGITFGLIYTIMPDLFPSFGLLMPLSFGMGPGISYSIAMNWEQYGFTDGAITGLTISAVGFIIAYVPGIIILRRGIRKGLANFIDKDADVSEELKKGIITRKSRKPIAGHLTTSVEAIEPLTLHLSFIGLSYAITYLILKLVELLLFSVGAGTEISTIWSFHFIFATVAAILLRNVIDNTNISHLVDSGLMTRLANFFMDFMVAASITAISFAVIQHYIVPILIMSVVAATATYFFIKWATYKFFSDYYFERFVSLFGDMTGTIQSSLVLLRVLDPSFKSRAGIDLVYGSGFALFIGFPLLLLINAPMNFFDDLIIGNWYVMLSLFLYLILLILALSVIGKHFNIGKKN